MRHSGCALGPAADSAGFAHAPAGLLCRRLCCLPEAQLHAGRCGDCGSTTHTPHQGEQQQQEAAALQALHANQRKPHSACSPLSSTPGSVAASATLVSLSWHACHPNKTCCRPSVAGSRTQTQLTCCQRCSRPCSTAHASTLVVGTSLSSLFAGLPSAALWQAVLLEEEVGPLPHVQGSMRL